jgi:hypothetical protein
MWRIRGWLCLLFYLLTLALQGCSKTAVSDMHVHTGKTDGVTYEVRGTGHARESRSANGDVEVTLGSNRLQIKGGRMMVNGKDCGAVKDGDSVVLDDNGQVSVNQEKR